MPEAYIYDHVRTPRGRGKADGALHEVTAVALATAQLKALKERNNLANDVVDDVILGVVDPVGEAVSDIARFAALNAGLGESVPGIQISRFCASGLDAVNFAAAQIMSGQHELTIGGGAESMSRVGIGASGGAWPMDPSIAVPGYFMPQGHSAGIVDGAGAVLLGSKEAGAKHGLKPRAKIRAFANIGSEPAMMLTGPVDVTEKLFERSGMKKSDIDLFELNEAFASVVLRYIQAFDIDNAKINVNGGAIALGHPLGATGAMILGTLLDELERTNKSTALVTLCIGGGMRTPTIFA